MLGYGLQFVEKVHAADPKRPGVALGLEAIKKRVGIGEIAGALGVSRTAVYTWFTGQYDPHKKHQLALRALLKNR